MVRYSIEKGSGHFGVTEYLGPFSEGQVDGGEVAYYSNPDDDPDTGSGAPQDRLERDKL